MHATVAHQWSSKAGHSRNSTEHARARTSTAQTHRITHILRAQTTAKPQQQSRKLEPKPIQQWKSAEWRNALKDKEFTDDGIRWMIVDVLYDRSEKVYMAIYIPRGEKNIAKNRERTPLKEIFELAKDTENWVKPEYLSSI